MDADEVFGRYSFATELGTDEVKQLRTAILSPSSSALRSILQMAVEVDKRDFARSAEFKALCRSGLDADEGCFRSEALECLILCNTISDRLYGITDIGKAMSRLAYPREKAARSPPVGQVDWGPKAVERLTRMRVHAAETNGASNSISSMGDSFDPVPYLVGAPVTEEGLRARYGVQLRRLEAAEQASHRNERDRPQFKLKDVSLLAALANATNSRSAVFDQIEAGRNIARSERRRLVERQSPVWRDLFDALFELRPSMGTARDSHEQAILDLPAFKVLSELGPKARGTALLEASEMQTILENIRSGKVVLLSNPPLDGGIGGLIHPCAYLPALAAVLLDVGAVECDDAAMASLIDQATSWRPLCRLQLLDSAERTLRAGSASATIAALRRMAAQPSHCFVPSRANGDYDGDSWWQDTPGRIAQPLAGRPDPAAPRTRFGQSIFGRRRG